MGKRFQGEFEQIVLLALARVGEGAYAVSIHDEILKTAGRTVSIPAVYVTLSRLEKKGLVTSKMGAPSAQPGGRARRCFELSRSGVDSIRGSRQLLDRMWAGLELAK